MTEQIPIHLTKEERLLLLALINSSQFSGTKEGLEQTFVLLNHIINKLGASIENIPEE